MFETETSKSCSSFVDSLLQNKCPSSQGLKPIYALSGKILNPGSVIGVDDYSTTPVFVISSGVIGLQHILGDGRRSLSTVYIAGEVIDFRYIDRTDGILVCLSLVKYCLFEGVAFDRLRREDPEFNKVLNTNRINQHRLTVRHCVDLARKSAVEKLASFIFECRSRQKATANNHLWLILKRCDIADYMGLRPETLSRAFTKLKHQKIISCVGDEHIRILKEPSLRQIANGGTAAVGYAA